MRLLLEILEDRLVCRFSGIVDPSFETAKLCATIQEQAKTLFEGKRGPKPIAGHQEPELLFSEIGKLKVELDWLKKKSGISR